MNQIIELLQEKGKTQTWLTEKLGKSYSIINGYSQNKKQSSLEVFYEIAKLLDVDVKDLIVSQKNIK